MVRMWSIGVCMGGAWEHCKGGRHGYGGGCGDEGRHLVSLYGRGKLPTPPPPFHNDISWSTLVLSSLSFLGYLGSDLTFLWQPLGVQPRHLHGHQGFGSIRTP